MKTFRNIFRNLVTSAMIIMMIVGTFLPYTVTPNATFGVNAAHATNDDDSKKDHKMVICHATSSESNPWLRLEVSKHASNGHFDENGTPRSGHTEDVMFDDVNANCPEVEVVDDNETPTITVDPVTLTFTQNTTPSGDPILDGTTATDPEDGDITGDIVVGGDNVDYNTPGTYTVTYDVQDSEGASAPQKTRTITVTNTPSECNDDIDNDGDGSTDFTEDAGCDSPEDNDENDAPVITVDPTAETITTGSTYDPLHDVSANDAEDGDITGDIVTDLGGFDVTTPGTYTITYNVVDSEGEAADEKMREVVVEDGTGGQNNPPMIIVNPEEQTIVIGTDYDPLAGVTALDNEDGNITDDIVTDLGGFDKDTLGTYTILYNVTDSNDVSALEQTRTITVVENTCEDEGCGGGNPPVLTLIGDEQIEIYYDEPFVDPGATATDVEDGNLDAQIIASGNVPEITGTYTRTYNVTDSDGNAATPISRTVVVKNRPGGGCVGNCGGSGPVNQAPTITLTAPNPVQLLVGQSYVEPGYSATDPEDGDITEDVVVVNADAVDTTTIGEYTIVYTVTDSQGLSANTSRTVVVGDILGDIDIYPACSLRFTTYMRMGSRGGEVAELQSWLNEEFGSQLRVDGVFGPQTHQAVKRYQERYQRYVLNPWELPQSTGYFYKTSRYMANLLDGCLEDPVFLEDVNITHAIVDQTTITQLQSTVE